MIQPKVSQFLALPLSSAIPEVGGIVVRSSQLPCRMEDRREAFRVSAYRQHFRCCDSNDLLGPSEELTPMFTSLRALGLSPSPRSGCFLLKLPRFFPWL